MIPPVNGRPQDQMKSTTVLSALAVLLVACSGDPEPAAQPDVRGERLVVRQQVVPTLKPASATITSRDLAQARARISGTLVRLSVREGVVVTEGQVLGVVSDDRLSLQTAALDAAVSAAEADAVLARDRLARVQTLFDRGFYAQAALDQARAASQAAEAQLRAARAQRAASVETASQGRILAPVAGRVLTADVPEGSVVVAGQSIATITAGPLVLRLELPEAQGRRLSQGQQVRVEGEDLPATGTVAQIYPAAVAGRVVADIAVDGLASDRVGQRVLVQVPLGQQEALLAPRRFIAMRHGLAYVRTIDDAGRVSEAPVQLGDSDDADTVRILAGVSEGDTLVVPEPGR